LIAHGWFGLVPLLVHLAIIATVVSLVRRKRRFAATACAAAYLAAWALTAWLGARDVSEHFRSHFAELCRSRGEAKSLDYDPMRLSFLNDTPLEVKPPWYFVGKPTALCPFVVTADYGCMIGDTNGSGGTGYFLWFFGQQVFLKHYFVWSS